MFDLKKSTVWVAKTGTSKPEFVFKKTEKLLDISCLHSFFHYEISQIMKSHKRIFNLKILLMNLYQSTFLNPTTLDKRKYEDESDSTLFLLPL